VSTEAWLSCIHFQFTKINKDRPASLLAEILKDQPDEEGRIPHIASSHTFTYIPDSLLGRSILFRVFAVRLNLSKKGLNYTETGIRTGDIFFIQNESEN
jgi:hypothetical protein